MPILSPLHWLFLFSSSAIAYVAGSVIFKDYDEAYRLGKYLLVFFVGVVVGVGVV